ncbi:MAG: hypothetical protein K1X56_05730 [Flavobacteriales bacterium]|nr:hypothetical protein [Flavobacteriales bacterium]
MKRPFVFLSVLLIAAESCTPELDKPEITSGSANVERFVIVGDGYLSGFSDGALGRNDQQFSVGALLFQSLSQGGALSFEQALMPYDEGLGRNAKNWESQFVSRSELGTRIDCEGLSSLGPVKRMYTTGDAQAYLDPVTVSSLHDLTVPYMSLTEYVASGIPANEYANRFCSSCTGGVMDKITEANPTFFAMMPGMEDLFRYVRNGGFNINLTDAATFEAALDVMLQRLNCKGVLATIPDFRTMPFYTTIPWNGADLDQENADSLTSIYASAGMNHIQFHEGKNGFIIQDPNAGGGYRQLLNGEYILLTVPLDSMKCSYYGIMINPIHDRYALDSAEIAQIDATRDAYNTAIRNKAQQYDLALADLDEYYTKLNSGITWNGVLYNSVFVSGNFFSLDGFHPTQKGSNLIANQFILAINAHYGSSFPTIYCNDCNSIKFP